MFGDGDGLGVAGREDGDGAGGQMTRVRVDWLGGVRGGGGDGEAYCFLFLSMRSCVVLCDRCRLFRVRLYHMLCPGFAFRVFCRARRLSLVV